MSNLFSQLEEVVDQIKHGWTTVEKAQALAASVVTIRPEVSVEIGVYSGKGLISLALAHKYVGIGKAIGIDPYSPSASVEGQTNEADKEWWAKLDHNFIYGECLNRITQFKVNNTVELIRKRSDEVEPPKNIGVLRIDGNHGEAVIGDIQRYCPNVVKGGILFLDDIGWSGGAVSRAVEELVIDGWCELYKLDDGAVFQKLSN
jgi:hypothetical protein